MENLDLTKILKNVSKGTKLYSPIVGDVYLENIQSNNCEYAITCYNHSIGHLHFTKDGKYYHLSNGECLLFPSKEQRDWSNFESPYTNKKFDIRTLKPFDKVLVRNKYNEYWAVNIFGNYNSNALHQFFCCGCCGNDGFKQCVPYKDNEHLLGTSDNCDEYYKTW